MQQIVTREKTFEFRRKAYPSTVTRVWFYEIAPISAVTYICEVDKANVRTRENPNPIPEDGVGNAEYNAFHADWDGYDYAYRVRSCRKLKQPVTLANLRQRYGLGGAPRSLVYVPDTLKDDVDWRAQDLVWSDAA